MDKVEQLITEGYKGFTPGDVLAWIVSNERGIAADMVIASINGKSYDYQTVLEWAAQQLIDEIDG